MFSWIKLLLETITRNWWQCTYISIDPSPYTKLPSYSRLKNWNSITTECVSTTSNTSTIIAGPSSTTSSKSCTTTRTEAAWICQCGAISFIITSPNLYRVSCRWMKKKTYFMLIISKLFLVFPFFSCWLFWLYFFVKTFFIAKMSLKTQAGVSQWYFFWMMF